MLQKILYYQQAELVFHFLISSLKEEKGVIFLVLPRATSQIFRNRTDTGAALNLANFGFLLSSSL